MKLVYRPCPAELRSSATTATSQARPSGDARSSGPALCAVVSVENGNNRPCFRYVDQYPIDNHAGPMFIHQKKNTFCGICGMCITLEDEQAVSWKVNPYTVTGPDAAQHADAGNEEFEELQQGEDRSLDCFSANERKFGVMPQPGWTGMYRAIIRQTKTTRGSDVPSYYISGVGRYHLWDSDPKARKMYNKCAYQAREPIFTIPRSKDDSLIDRQHFYNKKLTEKQKKSTTQIPPGKRVSVYPCHFYDDENQKFFPHGFPIHENCWKMAVSIIGADKLENDLKSFLTVLQQRWIQSSTITESQDIADWIVNDRNNSREWLDYIAPHLPYHDEYDVNRILVAMCDPIHVEDIEKIIAESARRYTVMKDKGTGDAQENSMAGASTMTGAQNYYRLHPEALMEILDQLHHDDVETYLNVTKHFVPWSYWKRRAPRDIIWELDSIDERTTPLDWQYSCLRAERLCEESFGLINRSRICDILREVNERMSRLADGQSEAVTNETSAGSSTLSVNSRGESSTAKGTARDNSEWEEVSGADDDDDDDGRTASSWETESTKLLDMECS